MQLLHKYSSFQLLLGYSFLLLSIKVLILPFVHPVDPDGVTRIFASLQWAENTFAIKSGNWGPLFFYLMGGALKLVNSRFYTPLIVNILISIMTLFPLYFLMKRIFNERTGLVMCIVFSLSPIIFRLSLLSLSETPFIFFIVLGASILAKGLMEQHDFHIFLSGLLIGLAGGFRFESWFITPLVGLIIAYRFSFKKALIFIIPALLFPAYWLTSNYYTTGEIFNSFKWASLGAESNKIASFESLLRRIWFFPLSLLFAFGPIAFYFLNKEVKNVFIVSNKVAIVFFLLFITLFLFYLFNCLRGSLLMQHRFTAFLYLLLFPFLGFYFKNKTKNVLTMAFLFSSSAFILAFMYSSKGARPIPRLLKKEAAIVNRVVQKGITKNSGFIIDYWDWEATYYLAYMSGLPPLKMVIFDQSNSGDEVLKGIEIVLAENPAGYILLCKGSRLENEIIISGDKLLVKKTQRQLKIKPIYESDEVILFQYYNN